MRSTLLVSAATLTIGALAPACSGATSTATAVATSTTAPDEDDHICLTDRPDETRCWLELDASEGNAAPLLIDLHGHGQTAARLRMYSGMEGVATREGLVVAWPDSPDQTWNDGSCCGREGLQDRDDVTFVSDLIEHVSSRLAIDPKRVYLTGFSNGCGLAQRIAVRRSDLITAVACYSDYLFDEPAPDYEPVPVLQIHGTSDGAVSYSPVGSRPGAIENAESWARHNGCAPTPEISETDELITYRYLGCRADADVVHVAIVDGEHVPTPEVEIHETIWTFLDQH